MSVPFTIVADDAMPPLPPIRPVPYPMGGGSPGAAGPTGAGPPPMPFAAIDPAVLDVDLASLVGDIRERVAGAFDQQLARVESTFASTLERMEAKLAQAELELAAVRAEHARVKDETERKAEALRELKKALENI